MPTMVMMVGISGSGKSYFARNVAGVINTFGGNAKVFSSDDIRNIRLSGRLYRYDDIRTLLDSYELTTGIHFSIDQKNIIISK